MTETGYAESSSVPPGWEAEVKRVVAAHWKPETERMYAMKMYEVGDTATIKPREWFEERMHGGSVLKGVGYTFVGSMLEYAGKEAKVVGLRTDGYSLDIDNGRWKWSDWMLGDRPGLPAEDALKVMLRGKKLYDKHGNEYLWSKEKCCFVTDKSDGSGILRIYDTREMPRLFRGKPSPKAARAMTRFEVLAWAGSEESRGWLVRDRFLDGWRLPQFFAYDGDLSQYQRARMFPDLSGIDESTVQGFELEEAK